MPCTGSTWYVLGRAVQAQCQEFLSTHPTALSSPGGWGKGKWLGGWVDGSAVSQTCPHIFSICPYWVGCPGKGGWELVPLCPGELRLALKWLKLPEPAAGVPPSRFLPAAFDRFLSVTTPQAWTPAHPHLV